MTLVRLVARPMLASIFIVQGVKMLRDPDSAVDQAKPVTDRLTPLLEKHLPQAPTNPRTLVRIAMISRRPVMNSAGTSSCTMRCISW